MYAFNKIRFVEDVSVNAVRPPKNKKTKFDYRKGEKLIAHTQPWVSDEEDPPREMCNLFFPDGGTAYGFPMSSFIFED